MKVSGDTISTLHFQTPTLFNLNSALVTASQGWMQDRAANDPSVVTIIKKAPTKVFSWLKAPSSAFTSKTLFRHLGRWTLTSSRHEIGTPTQLSYLIKGTGGFKNSFRRRPSPWLSQPMDRRSSNAGLLNGPSQIVPDWPGPVTRSHYNNVVWPQTMHMHSDRI